jgi:exodeoxyribonuclease VII small subunit
VRKAILHNSQRRLTPDCIAAKPIRMDAPAPDIGEMSFEQALRALEEVVRRLEGGDVPLEESIGLYERGEALRRHCQARLDAAQARIEKIVAGPDGKAAGAVPFDAD